MEAENHSRDNVFFSFSDSPTDCPQPVVIALALAILLPPLPLMIVTHVLGAPLYPPSLILNSGALCLHISVLSCLPLFYAHGVSAPAWRDVIAAWLPFDEAGVWGGAVGCFVGGWLGAIPMALDWDRDWQAWPVTILVGCYAGWAVGRLLLGLIFLRGRRIDMSVGPDRAIIDPKSE
jgi:GPI ethanolamine phosphate transferase 2/3 subunit F